VTASVLRKDGPAEEPRALPAVLAEHVSLRYATGQEALRDLSLRIESGEMVFITGPSGAGKSSLLRLLVGLERPTRGRLLVEGRLLGPWPSDVLAHHRQRIGIVFQDHRLLTDRTVFDNVALPLVIQGYAHREIGRRVRAALDQVGLLGKESARPLALSGGEQQRVGIARAVVTRPPILLADEPTGNLDPDLALEIMQLFARLNELSTTVLVSTHALEIVQRFRTRVLRLQEGRLVSDGLP
jgi:cell division transport system ATP-binding protein